MLTKEEIEAQVVKTSNARCQRCENHCSLTINMFDKKKFISGNRCERGSGNNGSNSMLPNMYSWKYDRLFNYKPLENAPRGEIGIPRVLNMYENYPFWFTFFTSLGFSVVISDHSNRRIYESGIESMPSESVCYPAKLVHGHIINLIKKGVKTIFYPCLMFEKREFENSDNNYNCPIVTSYSEAIKLNVEDLEKNNINYINPFLPIEPDKLLKRLLELKEFKPYKFKKSELKKAISLATKEQENYKKEVQQKGEEFLKYIVDHNEKAIVLAGRPYHLDKEVNHGIDTMINSLGLAVLSEDSICHLSKITSKIRVMNQWEYHARIFNACDVVSRYDNIELVNLNSFGCGLDAIVTDQAEEILRFNNKLFTTIKIDEVNNLGTAKIRIRSLIVSMNKRQKNKDYVPYSYHKNVFSESDKKHTLLFPDVSQFHMPLLGAALESQGYHPVYLRDTTEEMVETGLKYVNNDACYPAIIVIGQLVHTLLSGKYDINNTSVILTQTGGGCRATNYIGLIRKALEDAGLSQVSVMSLNFTGLEKDQAFKLNITLINKLLKAISYGDLLMKLSYATRPYEKHKGETNKVYSELEKMCIESLLHSKMGDYKRNINKIVNSFKKIEVYDKELPKIGIVGEILIKYHSFGNDHLVDKLEKEGVEVCAPELMGFVKYSAYNSLIKDKLFKTGSFYSYLCKKVLEIIHLYEKPIDKALKGTRYRKSVDIYKLADNVENILSVGNQTGEGWFLTGEMIELIKEGINNIVCVQPFACLPNHIVGKSVIKKVRKLYPNSNIVAIDYDPGASHTNQVNRIKLMLTVAKENQKNRNS
jgi:predicted nucleotide-binding protein (sugar kinase/HSP70/actin superfamily)